MAHEHSLHCSEWFLHTLLPGRRRGPSWDSWLQLTKEQSHPMALCSAIKARGKEKWEVDFHSYYVCLPSCYILSSKWLNNCPPIGNTGHIPLFGLLAHVAFAFPIKQSLSQPMRLFFPLLSLHPAGWEGVNRWVGIWPLAWGSPPHL